MVCFCFSKRNSCCSCLDSKVILLTASSPLLPQAIMSWNIFLVLPPVSLPLELLNKSSLSLLPKGPLCIDDIKTFPLYWHLKDTQQIFFLIPERRLEKLSCPHLQNMEHIRHLHLRGLQPQSYSRLGRKQSSKVDWTC